MTAGTLPGADRLVAAHPEATAIPLLTADEAFDAVPGTTLSRRDGRDLRDAPSPRPEPSAEPKVAPLEVVPPRGDLAVAQLEHAHHR